MDTAIFIVTTYGSPTEHEDTLKFFQWALSEVVVNRLSKEFNLKPHLLPMSKFTSQERLGKGEAIRFALDDAKINLKTISKDDVIVYMDGNQINYDDSFKMIELIKNKKHPFVTACRHNGMGIDAERGVIERFENYLVSQRYGLPHLPDVQCGCWAFSGDFFEEISKTFESEGFEIELELMNYFLGKGIYPAYVGMDIGKPKDTTFRPQHSLPKLMRLSNWLKFNSKILYTLAESFQKIYNVLLPPQYIGSFQNIEIYSDEPAKNIQLWKKWRGINCTCESKCITDNNIYHPCHPDFNYEEHHTKLFKGF